MNWRIKSLDSILATAEKKSLHRSLGAFQLTMLGIGGIIGTGIFVLTADAEHGQLERAEASVERFLLGRRQNGIERLDTPVHLFPLKRRPRLPVCRRVVIPSAHRGATVAGGSSVKRWAEGLDCRAGWAKTVQTLHGDEP